MEIGKFIKVIRDEEVKEIIVKMKDCIYRWTKDKTFIIPVVYPPNLSVDKKKLGDE